MPRLCTWTTKAMDVMGGSLRCAFAAAAMLPMAFPSHAADPCPSPLARVVSVQGTVDMRRAKLGLMRLEIYTRLVRLHSPDMCGSSDTPG